MDPVTVAGAVVAALTPYFVKAAEKFASAAGDAAWKKGGELYDKLKQRLAGKAGAETALEDLRKEPQDADNVAALRKELKKLLADDPSLLKELSALVAPAERGAASFHNEIAGNVGSITQIGSAGDVSIGVTKP